ncbi:T9SS type A sorting domain-containing protein, partial [bacterium]|nr:T9SS type A sorting domain-containing protein [bacterium]
FLNRQRVGIPIGGAGDSWEYGSSCWSRFHDWFKDDLAAALADSAWVNVVDYDGVVSVALLASSDGGATWQFYPCIPYGYNHPRWIAPPPTGQIAEGAEVLYYFEAVDGLGQTGTFPKSAPDDCFEFSILPITGSVTSPGILLVDKHRSQVPGEDRSWGHASLDYYREALDVLGYAYDVYEVEWPGTSCDVARGPDTSGMKYYDTQIWITGNLRTETIGADDQLHLVEWLSEATGDNERNLLVAGDNIGWELIGDGADTLGFYTTWLAAEYLSDSVGEVTVDSLPVLQDADGSFDFMTFDDRRCWLRGGCPELGYFDVVQPYPGAAGTELVAEYVRTDMTVLPAGVAHTDTIYGYQTVTLGFGIESMVDVPLPSGHYASGASDRVDLMSNVMDYFGKPTTGPGTGVPGDEQLVDSLEHAHPNPFNPSTTIEFSIATRGRVTARVYDLAGRKLRTLLDEVLEPGAHRTCWDGRTDGGRGAPSGVYFIRVEAAGFHATRKLVLLR